jgi:hypothetical protein
MLDISKDNIKEVVLIDGKKVFISKMSYFVKSDNCKHSYKETCKDCVLFGSYIPEQVLKALQDGTGGLK